MVENINKLLILGGTKISCEIVKQAQKMGYYTVVADYNEPVDSPAKLIADEHFIISATDVDAVVELIKREHINGVMVGFADVLLPSYAEICRKAGLPSLATKEQFELFTDKNQYKKLLQKYGVPTPDSFEVHLGETVDTHRIQYPIIIKPSDSSGARGCVICNNEYEFNIALSESLKFSRNETVIIEEYIHGREVTAFYLIQNGIPYFTALGNRHIENYQAEGTLPLPVGYSYPSELTESYQKNIAPKVDAMLRGEGIENGMMFMQCVVHDGVPKVYDIGLRLTGTLEYYMLEKTCGFNPLEMMIRFAVTGSMSESIENKVDPFLHGYYGWNVSALMKPGIVDSIEGLDNIRTIDDLLAAVVSHEVGTELFETDRGLLKQICCRFLGASNDYLHMKRTIDEIRAEFDVKNKNGDSLLLPMMDVEMYKEELPIQHH